MNLIQTLNKEQADKLSAGKTIPDFEPGDTVIVNVKVNEGERTRVQAYEGVCIGRSGHGLNESFTVRKISYGEGVERVFPLLAPMIELDQARPPRQGAPRQALLPARPARQVGAHRRGHASRRPDHGRAEPEGRRSRVCRSASAASDARPAPSKDRPFGCRRSRRSRLAISRPCRTVPMYAGSFSAITARLPGRFFGRLIGVRAQAAL